MKATLSEWNELLKEFLKPTTIKAYYRKHKGSDLALKLIAIKHNEKLFRSDLYASDYYSSINKEKDIYKKAFFKAIYRDLAVGKEKIDLDIEHKTDEAKEYFLKNSSLFIREGDSKDFVVLVEIIRKYKENIERNAMYRTMLKGKTLYEQNENAKKILEDAQNLLHIMGSDIQLPQFQEPFDNKELTKKAKEDILCLDISFDTTNTVDKLLEDIRKL
ncbi:MAG: hypothetical protein AB7S65_08135 [Sulfuricurvum sp.]